ncbi:hypothetical protein FPV67DRAFT_1021889 [Lyophyllum atratum]|nr:hypothetical protein FPV67DRAFT_1021889 [Lyophyllum atratum]
MGKKVKKWYVVTVGKDVGVFESWLEASSLISGVPGALHESFNSEEEARRIFHRQRDNGNTKICERKAGVFPLGAARRDCWKLPSLGGLLSQPPLPHGCHLWSCTLT